MLEKVVLFGMATMILFAALSGTTAKPIIVVREGGSLEPLPHKATIQIYGDGRIKAYERQRQVTPDLVQALVARLRKLGAYKMDQAKMDKDLATMPEGSKRGGSGVVTLELTDGRKTVVVTVNQPATFGDAKPAQPRTFIAALDAIKAVAKPADPNAPVRP